LVRFIIFGNTCYLHYHYWSCWRGPQGIGLRWTTYPSQELSIHCRNAPSFYLSPRCLIFFWSLKNTKSKTAWWLIKFHQERQAHRQRKIHL